MSIENSYSVILPTLNEVGHINSLIEDISNIFKKQNVQYEIIIVDDNSKDGTLEEIFKIDDPQIILHKRINKKKFSRSLNEVFICPKINI